MNIIEAMCKFEQECAGRTHTYIVFWDMTGLESLIEIPFEEVAADMANQLSDSGHTTVANKYGSIIRMMNVRAQANEQRRYEGFVFHTDLSEEEIRECFESYPQVIVDAIRRRGSRFCGGDPENRPKQVIF